MGVESIKLRISRRLGAPEPLGVVRGVTGVVANLPLIGYFSSMTNKQMTLNELTFADQYVKHRSPIEAYRTAYDATRMRPSTAHRNAQFVLKREHVQNYISEKLAAIGETIHEETAFDVTQALQAFMDIATADPDELTGLRVGACRYCYGDGHNFQWRHDREYMEALRKAEKDGEDDLPLPDGGFGYRRTVAPHPDCPECDGLGEQYFAPVDTSKISPSAKALFQGVKPTAAGPQVLVADKAKALENAAKIVGAFTEKLHVTGDLATKVTTIRIVGPLTTPAEEGSVEGSNGDDT